MSVVLSAISVVSIIVAVVLTYRGGGMATFRMGEVCFLAMLMAVAGIILGILGIRKANTFHVLPITGIVVCTATILFLIRIIYAGVLVI